MLPSFQLFGDSHATAGGAGLQILGLAHLDRLADDELDGVQTLPEVLDEFLDLADLSPQDAFQLLLLGVHPLLVVIGYLG